MNNPIMQYGVGNQRDKQAQQGLNKQTTAKLVISHPSNPVTKVHHAK